MLFDRRRDRLFVRTSVKSEQRGGSESVLFLLSSSSSLRLMFSILWNTSWWEVGKLNSKQKQCGGTRTSFTPERKCARPCFDLHFIEQKFRLNSCSRTDTMAALETTNDPLSISSSNGELFALALLVVLNLARGGRRSQWSCVLFPS